MKMSLNYLKYFFLYIFNTRGGGGGEIASRIELKMIWFLGQSY